MSSSLVISEKREREDTETGGEIVKKIRVGNELIELDPNVERTSNLAAPTMVLSGHGAAVYSIKFDPSGQNLASGSVDKTVLLWNVYGDCSNYNMLRAHKNAVLEVAWGDQGRKLVSASADRTLALWDPNAGKLKKKFTGHSNIVNSCGFGRRSGTMVVSGSDDGTVRVWDTRVRNAIDTFDSKWPVLSVCVSKDDDQIFSGGLDNEVKVWDLRKGDVDYVLEGHTDSITGLSLSPDGSFLLSNSMDNGLYQWDVRPFKEGSRLIKTYTGLVHNYEKLLLRCSWSITGMMVSAGSSDRMVHVWDEMSAQELYTLPGHTGSVNEVVFHPKEPIIGSCGNDKNIYLGELSS
mmetsp:Transcript_5165/g.7155  ORF Transcript_5165/g.7155 Transcript_5165/m.7155 type:complete len:349 (+) Transcript_5165:62-1108(+)|eukprot:CAMPEP_0117756742 /NCGR_PEP_ID=MMETSP0947-20121206/14280_1 /TAXON_ID=44440 /ORGANISM="Chattonella subsalsa, Strain CCMP2191" /LENGTH=348 /DNA_ID=CAMNT_0005576429 /DNA_START=37 /DNA_END=1083 /DNA_ORIENTATION=+